MWKRIQQIDKRLKQRPARAEANKLLGTLPRKGREIYELHYGADAKTMLRNALATGNIGRVLAHQYVITADVRFALDAVQNQVLDLQRPCLHEFLRSREYGATEPYDAAIEDP